MKERVLLKRVQPIQHLCCVPIRCGLSLVALLVASGGVFSVVEAYLAFALPKEDMPSFVQSDGNAETMWRLMVIVSDLLMLWAAIGAVNWLFSNFLSANSTLARSLLLLFLVMFMRVGLSVTEVIMAVKPQNMHRYW